MSLAAALQDLSFQHLLKLMGQVLMADFTLPSFWAIVLGLSTINFTIFLGVFSSSCLLIDDFLSDDFFDGRSNQYQTTYFYFNGSQKQIL